MGRGVARWEQKGKIIPAPRSLQLSSRAKNRQKAKVDLAPAGLRLRLRTSWDFFFGLNSETKKSQTLTAFHVQFLLRLQAF